MVDIALNEKLDIDFINGDIVTTQNLHSYMLIALFGERDNNITLLNNSGSYLYKYIAQNKITTKYLNNIRFVTKEAFKELEDNNLIDDVKINLNVINNSLKLNIELNNLKIDEVETYEFKL